ncbi:hypothetical protein L1887_48258 [Cichorium endivia]|nr:hypothetical protein L1887_48258 [Cichorium endivia]
MAISTRLLPISLESVCRRQSMPAPPCAEEEKATAAPYSVHARGTAFLLEPLDSRSRSTALTRMSPFGSTAMLLAPNWEASRRSFSSADDLRDAAAFRVRGTRQPLLRSQSAGFGFESRSVDYDTCSLRPCLQAAFAALPRPPLGPSECGISARTLSYSRPHVTQWDLDLLAGICRRDK